MAERLLDVKGLKTYFYTDEGVVRAVDGIDFHINKGETLGIVGESGSGKSVTALSIMRLIPTPPGRIVEGTISYNGRNLLELPPAQMRKIRGKEISMIFQEPMTSLNPVFTVGEQIAEAVRLHEGLGRRDAMAKTVDMQVAPARHLGTELDDPAVEGIDRRLLLGNLRLERPGLHRELPQLEPVGQEAAERRQGDREARESRDGGRAGEVEPDDPGTVAPDDEQAELFPVGPVRPCRAGARRHRPGGFRRRAGQRVNRRCLGNHDGPERARRVPEVGYEQSRVWTTLSLP